MLLWKHHSGTSTGHSKAAWVLQVLDSLLDFKQLCTISPQHPLKDLQKLMVNIPHVDVLDDTHTWY